MDAEAVLATLEKQGKPNTAKIYARHGVKDRTFGVSYADLGKLQKKLKRDHALAQALWKSKVHDARVLAAKIADPEKTTDKMIQRWIKDVKDHVISGAVADLAARMPAAESVALGWIESDKEFVASTGWAVIAQLAQEQTLKKTTAKKLITRIKRDIHRAPNRARYTMNSALIAIGGAMEGLSEPALKAAEKIGKVEVDHGQTNCKTPDAAPYIKKMLARR